MYVREGWRSATPGRWHRSAQRAAPSSGRVPYRMEYGRPTCPALRAERRGQLGSRTGVEEIHHREMALWTRLRDGLRAIDGVTLYCQDSAENHISVLLFNVRDSRRETWARCWTWTMASLPHRASLRPMVHEHLGIAKIHGGVRFGVGPSTPKRRLIERSMPWARSRRSDGRSGEDRLAAPPEHQGACRRRAGQPGAAPDRGWQHRIWSSPPGDTDIRPGVDFQNRGLHDTGQVRRRFVCWCFTMAER